MKLLIRTFTLITLTALMLTIVVRLNNVNYLINEIHNAAYLAVEETMNKEMAYLKSLKKETFEINEYFKNSFNRLVTNPDNYVLDVKGDEEHGILKAEISCQYSDLVRPVSLINIVEDHPEISTAGENSDIDSFDVQESDNSSRKDHVLYEKEFDEPVLLKSFYIDIEAYSRSNGDSPINRCEPEMTITLIDEDDREYVYENDPVSGFATTKEKNFDSDDTDFKPLKVKSVKLETKGISRSLAPKADKLRVGSTKKNYFEYEGGKTTTHYLYSRYIDKDTYSPSGNSIWQLEEYQNILKEF